MLAPESGKGRCATSLMNSASDAISFRDPGARPRAGTTRSDMKFPLLLATTMFMATAAFAQERATPPRSPLFLAQASPALTGALSAQDAQEFIAKLEPELAKESEYSNRIAWIAATYIMSDSEWLSARVGAELSPLAVARAKKAASFDRVSVDPV